MNIKKKPCLKKTVCTESGLCLIISVLTFLYVVGILGTRHCLCLCSVEALTFIDHFCTDVFARKIAGASILWTCHTQVIRDVSNRLIDVNCTFWNGNTNWTHKEKTRNKENNSLYLTCLQWQQHVFFQWIGGCFTIWKKNRSQQLKPQDSTVWLAKNSKTNAKSTLFTYNFCPYLLSCIFIFRVTFFSFFFFFEDGCC